MSRRFVAAVVWLGFALCGIEVRAESLEGRLNVLLGSEMVKGALVGVDVVEIGRGEVYSHNATLLLGPASNCKLLTTAAAFERYGSKATFKTYLYKVGEDLVVVGGGDPGLGDPKLAAEANRPLTSAFENWAGALHKAGVSSFRDLVVDDRVFDSERVNPDWPAKDAGAWYSAPIGGLNFNDNCDLKNVPIRDPGMFAGKALRDVLTQAGIRQSGTLRRVNDGEQVASGQLVASAETPLMQVIGRANKNSVNMMAECLCKRLGHDATGRAGSWENGTAAVKAYVTGVGADQAWLTLDDGSGLSNKNRVAAKAFTTVLAHVAQTADGQAFIDSLAVPGEDGTLRNRFKHMKVADAVHAKTGHITGVSTLSGYIVMPGKSGEGRRFAFSILCNKYQGNVNPWQDEVCEAIYTWALGK